MKNFFLDSYLLEKLAQKWKETLLAIDIDFWKKQNKTKLWVKRYTLLCKVLYTVVTYSGPDSNLFGGLFLYETVSNSEHELFKE